MNPWIRRQVHLRIPSAMAPDPKFPAWLAGWVFPLVSALIFSHCTTPPPTDTARVLSASRTLLARDARPVDRARKPMPDVLRNLYMGQGEPDPAVATGWADPALCRSVRVSYDFSRAMVDGGKTGVDVEVKRPDGSTLYFGFSLLAMIPDAGWCAVGETFYLVNSAPGKGTSAERRDALEIRCWDLKNGHLRAHRTLLTNRPMVSDLTLAYLPGPGTLRLVWDESSGFPSGLLALSLSRDGERLGDPAPVAKPVGLCFYDPRFHRTGNGLILVSRARRLIPWNRYRDVQTVALFPVDGQGNLESPRFLVWNDNYIESLSVHGDGVVVFKPVKEDPREIPLAALPGLSGP